MGYRLRRPQPGRAWRRLHGGHLESPGGCCTRSCPRARERSSPWRDAADKTLTALDTLKIYALKTSPAFEAALYAGLRLAASRETHEKMIVEFSRHLGVAFQILNDLKDWGRRRRQQARLRSGCVCRPADAAAGPRRRSGGLQAVRQAVAGHSRAGSNRDTRSAIDRTGAIYRDAARSSRRRRSWSRNTAPSPGGCRRRGRAGRTARASLLPGRFGARSAAHGCGTADRRPDPDRTVPLAREAGEGHLLAATGSSMQRCRCERAPAAA